MSTKPQGEQPDVTPTTPPADVVVARRASLVTSGGFREWWRDQLTLRTPIAAWKAVALGFACVGLILLGWWFLTRGPVEERIVNPLTLPSIGETFGAFHELWFDHALTRNTFTTLKRVFLGFVLAGLVGVPLGVLAGCFPRVNAFLAPVVMFGRNIPLAAVSPLLLYMIADGETRKIVFIFIACVAFVLSDTARAIADVSSQYIDTAYTLGASRWQTISKVLFPIALPQIFDSFRIMFGLAFGYIMLAESIKYANDFGGLGFLIQEFQRTGKREFIYLIIIVIPIVAFAVDRLLFLLQRQLFPHVYGGSGLLMRAIRGVLHTWDDLKRLVFKPHLPPQFTDSTPTAPEAKS